MIFNYSLTNIRNIYLQNDLSTLSHTTEACTKRLQGGQTRVPLECFRLLKSLVSKNIHLPKQTTYSKGKIYKAVYFYTFHVGLSLRALLVVFRILNDNDTRRDRIVFATLILFLGIFFYVF